MPSATPRETFTRTGWRTSGQLFKRCIKGTHVYVEPFDLFRYVDAECFRFNNRKIDDAERFLRADGKRLTYKSLIGEQPDAPVA